MTDPQFLWITGMLFFILGDTGGTIGVKILGGVLGTCAISYSIWLQYFV